MDDHEKYISERIARLRYNAGISAREMSLALGQNSSYINRIENGSAMPSMEKFYDICDYLQITPEEFFSSTDNPIKAKELYEKISNLSDKKLDIVLQIIDLLGKIEN